MSDKITIQDIIELLAEKHGMNKKDAELFVKGVFDLIEEALRKEKYVKVKGLGTFKLTEVESRESVNVNTGERFEIQGHTKISFTPDSIMKDLINKPFAHFETVILNENTNLEDTETQIEGEEEREDIAEEFVQEQEKTEEATSAEETEATIEEVSAVKETQIEVPAKQAKVEKETVTEIPADTNVNEPERTEEAINETITIAEAAITAAKEEKTIADTVTASEAISDKPETLTSPEPESPKETEKTEVIKPEQEKEEKKKTPWGIIIVIILILGIAGGIYWYLQSSAKEPAKQTVSTLPVATKETPKDSTNTQTSDSALIEETEMPQPTSTDLTPSVQPSQSVKPIANQEAANVTLADTVEYDITGTKTSHTLQEGESLIKLAVRFYGTKKLWPYIVKYNKSVIKDADRVPVGTVLRIPELTPKK